MAAETIKVWLKAFIPRNADGTTTVPAGQHAGETMLTTGPVDRCFLTDERGFSDDIDAHSRMHSEIEIDLRTRRIVRELHKCYETIEVDCETGEVTCVDSADTAGMTWENFQASGEGAITIDLSGSTHNPCMKVANVPVSPNLDYNGTLTVVLVEGGVSVSFNGSIETYPAFEMYASVNDGTPTTLFREDIAPGANLLSLTGPPGRAITYQIKIPVA
jgi:hypothetical protein